MPFPYLNEAYTIICILALVVGGVWRVSAVVARLEKALADYKVESANKYVTTDAIRQWQADLTAAINRLGDRLDRLVEKAG